MKFVNNNYERLAQCETDLLPNQFRYQALEQTIQVSETCSLSSAKMPSPKHPPRSLLRFLYRMIKDRDLYGELAFAETAESLHTNFEAMRIGSEDYVVGVTASGDVLLSLLAAGPKAIIGFDVNSVQTAITHLKVASVLALSVEDYKRLMGLETMPGATRRQVLSRISRSVPNSPRRRLLSMSELVAKGVLNNGMSHLIVELIVSIARAVMSKDTLALFLGEHGTDQERAAELQKIRNRRTFTRVLRPILRRLASRIKWLLFPHRFCAISHRPEEIIYDFLTVFETLLVRGIKANPTLCRAAVGQLHQEWADHLYSENAFAAIRNNVSRLTLHTVDFISGLKQIADGWATRLYLSNMPDYLSDEQLMELVREVKRAAAPGARIVYYSLYDKDLLPDLGPKIPAAELQALQDGDCVLIYPTVMVRTREQIP